MEKLRIFSVKEDVKGMDIIMYYLHGKDSKGGAYKIAFSSKTNFLLRIKEIQGNLDRDLPTIITGTRSADRIPAYIRTYLMEHKGYYQQIGSSGDATDQRRSYRLEIRTDDRMPQGMDGIISIINGTDIITINGNERPIEQLAAFLHEAVHLWRDDLGRSNKTAEEIEAECESDLIKACRYILDEYESRTQEA